MVCIKMIRLYRNDLIQAKSQFKRRSTANNVEIIIPVPNDADTPRFKTTVGSVRYVPEENATIWTIRSFPVCTQSRSKNKNKLRIASS